MFGVLGREEVIFSGDVDIPLASEPRDGIRSRFDVRLDTGTDGGGGPGVPVRDGMIELELNEAVEARLNAGVGTYSRSFVR